MVVSCRSLKRTRRHSSRLTLTAFLSCLCATMESRKRPLADDAEHTAQPKKRVVTSPGVGSSPHSIANGTPDAVPEPTADDQLEVGTPRVDLSFVVTLPLSFFSACFSHGYSSFAKTPSFVECVIMHERTRKARRTSHSWSSARAPVRRAWSRSPPVGNR